MSASAAGTGWKEAYLGGSQESEDAIVREKLVVWTNLNQRASMRLQGRSTLERGQHAKMLMGTKRARFVVAPDLPADLRLGFLRPGAEYPALVRFSNGDAFVQADAIGDVRGLAFRVKSGDAGEGLRDHDFLGTNAPATHVRNALDFMIMARAVNVPGKPEALWHLRGFRRIAAAVRVLRAMGLKEGVRALRRATQQTGHKVASVAEEQYWSRAPMDFGGVAVKYKMQPAPGGLVLSNPTKPSPDLRKELLARLGKGDVAFDLKVQRYLDDTRTPIEDGSIEWLEEETPPITIGRLIIPRQQVDEAEEQELERMAFNPWNVSSDDFRPIGNLNRVRRQVYDASSALRLGEQA